MKTAAVITTLCGPGAKYRMTEIKPIGNFLHIWSHIEQELKHMSNSEAQAFTRISSPCEDIYTTDFHHHQTSWTAH